MEYNFYTLQIFPPISTPSFSLSKLTIFFLTKIPCFSKLKKQSKIIIKLTTEKHSIFYLLYMGKYMRKPKLTGDTVAVIDVSPSSLGVRTRAKTLALQKLQQTSNSTPVTPPEHHGELCYLQLRSRRLEKPPVQKSTTCCRRQNPNPNFVNTSGGEETQESNYYFGENNVDFDGRERYNFYIIILISTIFL